MSTLSMGAHGAGSSNPGVHISSAFDSGNIALDESALPLGDKQGPGGSDAVEVRLKIVPDPFTELEERAHSQWFHFKCVGARASTKFTITNANGASYPQAWPGTTVCASLDRETWFRCVDTTYDQDAGTLSWTLGGTPAVSPTPNGGENAGENASHGSTVWFSYFAPYSFERHQDLVGRVARSPHARHAVLGRTLDGRDIDLLTIGDGETKVWVIARQHPGEPMAEWFAEGLLERLVCEEDALAAQLRQSCTFHVVPNMNPDGSVRGHLRTNAAGANLNREWAPTGSYHAPTLERSPEVYHVLEAMDASGVDLFFDVHGDEEVPLNFMAGMEGLPGWGPRLEALQGALLASYQRANPDMQTKFAYAPDGPKEANLAICSNQVAHRFGCLGVTLEQPFKDCATRPMPGQGWSPARAKRLGAAVLEATDHVRPLLRAEGDFWLLGGMDPRDKYVRPLEGTGESR